MVIKAVEIKQDINFLEYSLWFPNVRHDGLGFVWNDIEGYEYRSGYTPPDKVDIVILLYLLHKSQKIGYKELITCSKYEILKACGLFINTFYYERIDESLKRWSNVSIHFRGTFYDGKKYHSIIFHVMNSELKEQDKEVTVCFDANWLLKIKESKYFKYINFELYKALKRPLSRRLYEWLRKSFIGREKCYIKLTNLGKKFAMSGRETKHGSVIYASHVLAKIKPAINEINKLSRDPDIIKKTGIKPQDLFVITYEIRGENQDRVIIFEKHPVIFASTIKPTEEKDTSLEPLFIMLKRRGEKLEKTVASYYDKHGEDYVKWNILYANKHAKKNYAAYLGKALAENWAEEWQVEEKAKILAQEEAERKRLEELEEQRRQEEIEKQAEKQRPLFKQAVAKLSEEVKEKLWQEAEQATSGDAIRRQFMVKINYAEFLLQHLNSNGEDFLKEVLSDLKFIAEVSWK